MANVSVISAFVGGFLNFFSIWIFCLMQVTPFLLAFLIGASVKEGGLDAGKVEWREIITTGAAMFLGFMTVFVLIGMKTSISRAMFNNMQLLNIFGGVFLGLAGCYLAGLLTFRVASTRMKVVLRASGYLVGASLALAYKPCVTPTLTAIFNFNTMPENMLFGAVLLVCYSLGISTAIMLVGLALTKVASMIKSDSALMWVKKGCGALVIVVALLIITDKMTLYKSFLVERFVPADGGDGGHEEHDHGSHQHEEDEPHH
ncbi:MAG: hypothetical protein HY098_00160 [Nitrospinae bacterium]|nr:hypothetical protein [Nitrospinota bacterium]